MKGKPRGIEISDEAMELLMKEKERTNIPLKYILDSLIVSKLRDRKTENKGDEK